MLLLSETLITFGSADWYAGWGTLSLVNAGLAQSKNRSGLAWWLASLFLGPIATLLLVAFCEKLPERASLRASTARSA